jgi:hypothetical protein
MSFQGLCPKGHHQGPCLFWIVTVRTHYFNISYIATAQGL